MGKLILMMIACVVQAALERVELRREREPNLSVIKQLIVIFNDDVCHFLILQIPFS